MSINFALHPEADVLGMSYEEAGLAERGASWDPNTMFPRPLKVNRPPSLRDNAAVATFLASIHPLAHHATNIVVTEDPDGVVRVLSKGLSVGRKGRVVSAVYRDVVVRTADGWRLAPRRAEIRRPAE